MSRGICVYNNGLCSACSVFPFELFRHGQRSRAFQRAPYSETNELFRDARPFTRVRQSARAGCRLCRALVRYVTDDDVTVVMFRAMVQRQQDFIMELRIDILIKGSTCQQNNTVRALTMPERVDPRIWHPDDLRPARQGFFRHLPLLRHLPTFRLLPKYTTPSFSPSQSYSLRSYIAPTRLEHGNKRKLSPRDCMSGSVRQITEKVNFKLIRQWMSRCDTDKHQCHKLPHARSFRQTPFSFRLVDVKDKCLVDATTEDKYFALSYVWGKDKSGIVLEKANIANSRRPGAFRDNLPATILCAMYVTRKLNCRYIFIDRLCVLQDDADDQDKYIPAQGRIYSCASVTIVAGAGSDANNGLPGVSGTPRQLASRHVINVGHGTKLACIKPSEADPEGVLEEYMTQTTWATRGWTFQEMLLSPRLLIFTPDRVLWSCWQGRYVEDIAYERVALQPRKSSVQHSLRPYDDMSSLRGLGRTLAISKEFTGLVVLYHVRELSLHADKSRAIEGILSAFSAMYPPWSFHLAMSKPAFILELTWGVKNEDQYNRLCKSAPRADEPASCCPLFPSWSWLSCGGTLNWSSTSHDLKRSMLSSPCAFTTSIFTVDSSRSLTLLYEEKRPLSNAFEHGVLDEQDFKDAVPSLLLRSRGLKHAIMFAAYVVPCTVTGSTDVRLGRPSSQQTMSNDDPIALVNVSWQQKPVEINHKIKYSIVPLGSTLSNDTYFSWIECLLVSWHDGVGFRKAKFTCRKTDFQPAWTMGDWQPIVLC